MLLAKPRPKAQIGRMSENRPPSLGDACIREALILIEAQGIEALSLREVARRLGVSHQAPYKHFPSRDHLLLEVVRRCFTSLTAALRARDAHPDPGEDLRALGRAYLGFAAAHPLEYRLMFSTPWPQATAHPDLIRDARYSFEVLHETLARLRHAQGRGLETLEHDALFIWTCMHGLASITQSDAMAHLGMPQAMRASVPDHVMRMIDAAIHGGALT